MFPQGIARLSAILRKNAGGVKIAVRAGGAAPAGQCTARSGTGAASATHQCPISRAFR